MFDITITPEVVEVKSQTSDSVFSRLLIFGVIIFVAYKLMDVAPDSLPAPRYKEWKAFVYPLSVVILFLWVLCNSTFYLIRSFFPKGSSLNCNHETLTISKIPTFNFHGVWVSNSVPIKSVVQLQFAAVGYSRYGAIMGITFHADGKKYKVFSGLESPEANQILDGLQTLGVEVVRDPGMRMAVEMVLEQRNSKINKLLR